MMTLEKPPNATPRPGDKCREKNCSGRLVVYKTIINFIRSVRIRHLHCPSCGHIPPSNKWVIPLEYAPPKQKANGKHKD
jgi:hypothetical protein